MAELKKVLIVEDEEVLRDLYQAMLSTDGYENKYQVQAVGSAEEAKEVLTAEDYSIILTDYKLPGDSGIDLIRWTTSLGKETKCIILSGFLESTIVKSAFEAGAILCLKKPCSVDKILSAVDQAAQTKEDSEDESFLIESVIEANVTETLFIDPEYNIRFANRMFVDNYGSCVGKRCFQLFGTGAGVCPNCQAVAAVEEKKSRTRFRSARDPRGGVCELQERIDPWYNGDDKLIGLVLSFSKVGTSSQEEKEVLFHVDSSSVKQNEDRVLVFALDRDDRIVYSDEQFLNFLDLTCQQIEGTNFGDFLEKSFLTKLNRQRRTIVDWFKENLTDVVPLNIFNAKSKQLSTFMCESRTSPSLQELGWQVLVIARRNL